MVNSLRHYLFQSTAEPLKDTLHVATLLHGDHPGVVLLINPNEKCLLIVVPIKRGGKNKTVSLKRQALRNNLK